MILPAQLKRWLTTRLRPEAAAVVLSPRGYDCAAHVVHSVHIKVDESDDEAGHVPRAGLHGESVLLIVL